MKLIDDKYHKLEPSVEYLGDEVIMAQAWKKTHEYMRHHNWYADTLALDISALGLESNVRLWSNTVLDHSVKLRELELVPAAKSEEWVVDKNEGWIPKAFLEKEKGDLNTNLKIRPLAHITVRDQTWATAVLLCVADKIETLQGDCSETNYFIAQKRGVSNYGNRLICDWNEKNEAWFRWGNSQLYRKFYTDYQNFLRRPVELGKEIAKNRTSKDSIYIVNLDLKKFYDQIDRKILIDKLKKNCAPYLTNTIFWSAVEKIFDWKWDESAKESAKTIGLELKEGLPQGLVSAGFFANVYLLNFDENISSYINKAIPKLKGVVLYDYCRYVDDLRIVIGVEEDLDVSKIQEQINSFINKQLEREFGATLELNREKTKITSLSDLDSNGSVSVRLSHLQKDLSGPADRDMLESIGGVLEGFLSIQPDESFTDIPSNKDAELVKLTNFNHDVRSDTLKRFAANRLESLMRNKRRIDVSDDHENSISSIDNESELLAKKLIKAWMQDPSLALLLRKAFEIYPSPDIAETVFESIISRCNLITEEVNHGTAAFFRYLLADLIRCCIDFHAFFQRVEYPVTANPKELLNVACTFAQKTLDSCKTPEFLRRQALLLLAILQKPVLLQKNPITIQDNLHCLLSGKAIDNKRQYLALYEVAAQITDSPNIFADRLLQNIENAEPDKQVEILFELASRGGPFWEAIWKKINKSKLSKNTTKTIAWARPAKKVSLRGKRQELSKIIESDENPFVHEAALLKLAIALITLINERESYLSSSPSQVVVKIISKNETWADVLNPGVEIACSYKSSGPAEYDKRFTPPKWLLNEFDAKAIYWLGNILRAAAVGCSDFTSSRWRKSKVNSYKGLRTGWFKRRMGMMHAPEALVGDFATLSTWASELLMISLQWPGFESSYLSHRELTEVDSIDELLRLLKNKLQIQDDLFCKTVGMPALITSVKRPKQRHEKGFRLVTVQQLLPRTSSFSKSDPTQCEPKTKSANREHLAKICHITYKTLKTILHAENKDSYPGADLIVFPELAVHEDDQDLIKRLADKTQSIIFAGLIFKDLNGKLINIARWFIPDYKDSGRQWVIRDQGKQYPTEAEIPLGITGYRPCQHIIEIIGESEGPFKISGAICYDATDLKLASDLKHLTHLFVIAAHNKDVRTFDAMASALHYHMYQHVVIVNKGEFGGSTIQAPYKEPYDRLISHSHGTDQISINVADLDLAAFKRKNRQFRNVKTPPAN